ncbi:MAG: hypothetical protein ACYS99_13160 [Planctomycetota bacterium]|jgi:hypothetical protein
MEKRSAVLLLWAVVATIAAIWLALRSEPTVAPGKPPVEQVRTEPDRPYRPRGAGSLEGFLALALAPPVPEKEDGRPVPEQVRALFKEHLAHQDPEDWSSGKSQEIHRKMFALVARSEEAHLALMEILAEADEDAAHEVLTFLVWNPFVKQITNRDVTLAIKARAREMIASDPGLARREAAIRILFRYDEYDPEGRSNFDFGLERLDAEPSVEVRDALLSEMSVAGTRFGLTREEATPFVERLRGRLEDGVAWCAIPLSDWSTDADDFRRIKEKLATERDPRKRQKLLNAFSGDRALVRDRTEEARAVLMAVLSDPAEDSGVRSLARGFLTTTFGPLDAASADAVRRYDGEQEGR